MTFAISPKARRATTRNGRARREAKAKAKLRIGAPNDKYEQEADRVADQVMRMTEPAVEPSSKNETSAATLNVQRKCAACATSGSFCPECAEEETL